MCIFLHIVFLPYVESSLYDYIIISLGGRREKSTGEESRRPGYEILVGLQMSIALQIQPVNAEPRPRFNFYLWSTDLDYPHRR